MLMAGLDGIQRRINPADRIDKNLYDHRRNLRKCLSRPDRWRKCSTHSRRTMISFLPGTSLPRKTHLDYKRPREIDEIRLRLHPYEFFLYYDA